MRARGRLAALVIAALAVVVLLGAGGSATASSSSATLVGDLEHYIGTCGDWQQNCASAHMSDPGDGVYRFTLALPAGSYQYKVAINDSWDENYGAHAAPGGDNIALHLSAPTTVHFYYDPV